MGANQSSANQSSYEEKQADLLKEMNEISAGYISKMHDSDMYNLTNAADCNNLMILTADIIAKKLNKLDVEYLANTIENGDEKTTQDTAEVIFWSKDKLYGIGEEDIEKKQQLCLGIAKFYIKIAHLFAAIKQAIDPKVVDMSGNEVVSPPVMGETARIVVGKNICNERLANLINNTNIDEIYGADKKTPINIKPNFCDMNKAINNLSEYNGVQKLEQLYYDVYNDKTNKFDIMSDKMKKIYNKDLKEFYKAFTGDTKTPKNISSFKDIKLKQYNISQGCSGNIMGQSDLYRNQYTSSSKNKLFKKYANNIRAMQENAYKYHMELLNILRELFISYNEDGKKHITINPELMKGKPYVKLQELVEKTRGIIVALYTKCEQDFEKGLLIFEEIVETQIKQTSNRQISILKESLENEEDTNLNADEINQDEETDEPIEEEVNEPIEEEVNEPIIEQEENEPIIEQEENEPIEEQEVNEPIIEDEREEQVIEEAVDGAMGETLDEVISEAIEEPIEEEKEELPEMDEVSESLESASATPMAEKPDSPSSR